MESMIGKPVKTKKFQQVIWLEYDDYMWVMGLVGESGLAPNMVIAKIVQAAKKYSEQGVWKPIIEREVRVVGYRCPFCEYSGPGASELINHLAAKHRDQLKQILEG